TVWLKTLPSTRILRYNVGYSYPERHIFASCEIKTKMVLRYPPKGICLPYFSIRPKPRKETRSCQLNDSDLWAEGHLYFPSDHMELRQVRKCAKDALVVICEFMLGYQNFLNAHSEDYCGINHFWPFDPVLPTLFRGKVDKACFKQDLGDAK
ncbi:hypothetical protein PDJAM_G00127180, partial [Pangasius djambal]|nr:hypothetical protein [Pangasius djambal]